jgi:hypothetical protein
MKRISEITRRNLFDALSVERSSWSGRLYEAEFLGRLYDLKGLPSTDRRFADAGGDIWQHRINNPTDWPDTWIFADPRFGLLDGDDETLLRFLCETIHPVVRPDVTEVERLRQLYNEQLAPDGYEIIEKTRISGRPVFAARHAGAAAAPGLSVAKGSLVTADPAYVTQQITRMEAAIYPDPDLAIGTAKELIETCCRTILSERGADEPKDADLARLVKATARVLALTPADIPDAAKAVDSIRRLLSNLATIAQGIAELRNSYGTGHGRKARSKGLEPRHAKLAVGAASTLAVFLIETHQARTTGR